MAHLLRSDHSCSVRRDALGVGSGFPPRDLRGVPPRGPGGRPVVGRSCTGDSGGRRGDPHARAGSAMGRGLSTLDPVPGRQAGSHLFSCCPRFTGSSLGDESWTDVCGPDAHRQALRDARRGSIERGELGGARSRLAVIAVGSRARRGHARLLPQARQVRVLRPSVTAWIVQRYRSITRQPNQTTTTASDPMRQTSSGLRQVVSIAAEGREHSVRVDRRSALTSL